MENVRDRFCIGIGYRGTYDLEDAFRCMAEAGFRKTFLAIVNELPFIGAEFRPLKEYTERFGLELCNLHLPVVSPNPLWEPGRARDVLLEKYCAYLDAAAEAGIRSLVIHVCDEGRQIALNSAGTDALHLLCERAERYGTDLCVENVRNIRMLDYVFANVKSPSLKFCHDAGHNRAYTPEYELAERFGKYLGFTHIHDNDGVTDLHEMPFTGVVDFARLRRQYEQAGYKGVLCLETTPQLAHKQYGGFAPFFRLAYESLERIFCGGN